MADINSFRENLRSLIWKFEQDKNHYLQKGYPEAQVRIDFLNPFFDALGWDIENKAHKPPHERDVIVERPSENTKETAKRPDYNFRVGNATKFFVEAKAPSVALDDVNHIMQAKSYAWHEPGVYFVILTDFEELKLFDASLQPNPKYPQEGLLFNFKYTDYLANAEKLWELSKERVEQGSLEALLPKDAKSKRLRIPPDKAFLEDLSTWRKELASDIHKQNQGFDEKLLNDVVQKLLDRIIFIRIAEDRRIIDRVLWDTVGLWRAEGKRKSIMTHLVDLFREINDDLNGDIFKPHACEKANVDSALIADIIENLYLPKSIYRFDRINVELLGSIYERYLGSTLHVTPKRVSLEKKPEVIKAGGVYYTPKFIVDYIVKNTVGKLIEGKTPKQIEKIKILDPACGSGSFLLGAYNELIEYHKKYYLAHPKDAQTLHLDMFVKMNPEDFALPLREKAKILRNNIFGVDIDPQAVEITMMSLYLKALEGERGMLPRKQHLLPSMGSNVKHGNSLISYDILDQGQLFNDEAKRKINVFDWDSKGTGFGDIMTNSGFDIVIGNPPYGYMIPPVEQEYFSAHYKHQDYQKDLYLLFLERYHKLLSNSGLLGVIISNTWLQSINLRKIRQYLTENYRWLKILHLPDKVFSAVVDTHVLVFQKSEKGFSGKEVVSIDVRRDGRFEPLHNLSSKFISHNGDPINIVTPQEGQLLFKKIVKTSSPVLNICDVFNGVKPFEKGKGTPPQTEKILKEKPYVIEGKAPDKTWSPLLRGELIQRYENKWNKNYWIKYGPWLAAPRDPSIFEAPVKIVVRQTGDSIIATLIETGFVARNNLHILLPKDTRYSLNYILALMNSRLMDFAYTFINPEKGEALAEIKKQHVEKLPIRAIDFKKPSEKASHDKLVSLTDRMLDLHKKNAALPASAEREKIEREIIITEEKIDEIVYVLYGITKTEKRIIEGKG